MNGFPPPSASKMGNLIVNPSGTDPGTLETYIREWRWWALGMSPLWGFPPMRGDNVVIPQSPGQRAYPQYADQGTYTVAMSVCGDAGVSGAAPTGSYFTQLRENLDHLATNVASYGLSTRAARLVLPDASTIDFDAQFKITLVEQTIAIASLMLDVVVPAGRIEAG